MSNSLSYNIKEYWKIISKRIIDIVISTAGIIILLPFWLIAGTAIMLDSPGLVFYVQQRLGRKGKPFNLIKLRTMYKDAEMKTGPVWAGKNDKRITKVGKYLRKWHLDETPQFINVLIGEMSIVGPRPERNEIVKKLENEVPKYRERLQVKPGITGLSQIHQTYDSCIRDVKRKLRYDLLYISKMCTYFDIKILYLTFFWVLQQKGD